MQNTPSPFAHKISGQWYFSDDCKPVATSLADYRALLKSIYGDLRGVRIAELGKDYDAIGGFQNRYPVKNGYYI